MAKPYIYRISNSFTGEFYIGVRSANVRLGKTFTEDTKYWGSSDYLKDAMKAHPEGWVKVCLHEFDCVKDAVDAEPAAIADVFGTSGCLNKSPAGPNWHSTAGAAEVLAKIKAAQQTPAAKEKMVIAATGRKHSATSKLKMREAKLDKKLSQEHKATLSAAHQSRPEEAKAITAGKLSLVNSGRQRSAETIQRMSEAQRGKKKGIGWSDARRAAQHSKGA